MSKNSLLLDKAEIALFQQAAQLPSKPARRPREYSELILRLFRTPSAVAFIGPDARIARKVCGRVAAELAETGKRVAVVQVEALLSMPHPPPADESACLAGRAPNVWHWPAAGSASIELFQSRPAAQQPPSRWIDSLLRNFDSVLLDCPPLETSPAVVDIAALADAAVIVVETGTTPKPEILRTQQLLQQYNVKLAGCVLAGR